MHICQLIPYYLVVLLALKRDHPSCPSWVHGKLGLCCLHVSQYLSHSGISFIFSSSLTPFCCEKAIQLLLDEDGSSGSKQRVLKVNVLFWHVCAHYTILSPLVPFFTTSTGNTFKLFNTGGNTEGTGRAETEGRTVMQ